MPCEVWGTFSVADHLREHPFVADVLLYDKLVIPIVPRDDPNQSERNRWREQGWQPDEQDKIVEDLVKTNANLVLPVEWDRFKQAQFRDLFQVAGALAADTHDLKTTREIDPDRPPFQVSRRILYNFASDLENFPDLPSNVWVEAMAAYPSYDRFSDEVSFSIGGKKPQATDTKLAGVFGWEFVVPDEPKMTNLELLTSAATLASDESFKEKRRDFHNWRRRVITEGITGPIALAEMADLLDRYNEVIRNSQLRTKTLFGFSVAKIVVDVVGAFVPFVSLANIFFDVGSLGSEQWLPDMQPSPDQRAAAMFHDARKQFGWH